MKQRLVGTIVIGCLAIIFIPILLDGEGVSPPAMTTEIPDPPPLPVEPIIEQQRPQITSDNLSESTGQTDNTENQITANSYAAHSCSGTSAAEQCRVAGHVGGKAGFFW